MSKFRTKRDAWKANPDLFKLAKGPNGRNLCRVCSTEVLPPRRSFCSKECVHQWNIRNNWRYARRCVRKRDKGICAICSLDCIALRKELNKLSTQERYAKGAEYGIPKHRAFSGCLFDVDHIIPVAEDGCEPNGGVGLEGLRTLCIRCHKKVTKELRARLISSH